jgi:hypothetical protein
MPDLGPRVGAWTAMVAWGTADKVDWDKWTFSRCEDPDMLLIDKHTLQRAIDYAIEGRWQKFYTMLGITEVSDG